MEMEMEMETEIKWTKEQRAVIELRGKNILVSAAAGSGKTAVLVERIISKVARDDNPTDIDRLLVVTFTRAAASEMRERILKELVKEAAARPDDEHLAKQLSYIHNANIMTIDSFCNMMLRENFNFAGIDPSYRIGDENELALIKSDVIKDILEKRYENADEQFINFVETNTTGRDDTNLEKLILNIYNFACSHVNPEEWLDKCVENYEFDTDIEDVEWFKDAVSHIDGILLECARMAGNAVNIIDEYGLFKYFEIFKKEYENFLAAADERDINKKFEAVRNMTFERLPSILKKDMCDEKSKLRAQWLRKRYKQETEILQERFCQKSVRQIEEEIRASAVNIKVMADITREFMREYFEYKTDKNILDFNDIIHLVIKMFKNDDMTPSALAKELSEKYDEIMIDEYQDSNYLQDELLSAVSKETAGIHNMFMVGDVKQSIYKFRLAKPEIFLQKYAVYGDLEEDTDNVRINLSSNFRSRKEVTDSVNFVFEQIMGAELGGIEYDGNQKLYPKSAYPYPPDVDVTGHNPYETEILLIDNDGEIDGRECEAVSVAIRINELVHKEKFRVYDKKTGNFRRIKYGDIAVLMRGAKTNAPVYGEIFASYGIPSYSEITTGFFDTFEIKNLVALLKITDNPLQDIPLGAALRNIFGFTTEDMAIIRMGRKNMALYDSILKFLEETCLEACEQMYACTYKKAELFIDSLTRYRSRASYMKLRDLIGYMLNDTGFEDYVTAMPAGERRAANIKLLKEKAASYEKISYSGLFNFVRYIERVKSSDTDMGEAGLVTGGDAVSIMTIHKSKGLEFPVVILADTCRGFNKSDTHSRVIMHQDIGIATDYVDTERRTRSRSIFKSYMAGKMEKDNIAEELRILYVAMTRAKEKLIITGCKNAETILKKASESTEGTGDAAKYLGMQIVGKAACYMDWILYANARTEKIDVKVISPENLVDVIIKDNMLDTMTKEKLLSPASDAREDLFSYEYPYAAETKIFSKYSVSEIKKMKMEELSDSEDTKNLYEHISSDGGYVPEFIEKRSPVTGGAMRGTAYHRFFELLDYGGDIDTAQGIESQLAELVEKGYMEAGAAEVIDVGKILNFTKSRIGKRMAAANARGELSRERQYVMSVPAKYFAQGYEGEEVVLVQGIIDAFFEEDGNIVLVDYKTDNVAKPEDLEKLYKSQLEYYAMALCRVTGKNVSEKIIYSVKFDREVEIS